MPGPGVLSTLLFPVPSSMCLSFPFLVISKAWWASRENENEIATAIAEAQPTRFWQPVLVGHCLANSGAFPVGRVESRCDL